MTPQLGPYSDVQVVHAARSMRAIQEMLNRGWSLLHIEFREELSEGGMGTRHQVRQHVPYAIFGRSFEEGEDQLKAREIATESSEDNLRDGQTIRVRPAGDDQPGTGDEVNVRAPLTAVTPADEAPNTSGTLAIDTTPPQATEQELSAMDEIRQRNAKPAVRTGDAGVGETEVSGLPNARR